MQEFVKYEFILNVFFFLLLFLFILNGDAPDDEMVRDFLLFPLYMYTSYLFFVLIFFRDDANFETIDNQPI